MPCQRLRGKYRLKDEAHSSTYSVRSLRHAQQRRPCYLPGVSQSQQKRDTAGLGCGVLSFTAVCVAASARRACHDVRSRCQGTTCLRLFRWYNIIHMHAESGLFSWSDDGALAWCIFVFFCMKRHLEKHETPVIAFTVIAANPRSVAVLLYAFGRRRSLQKSPGWAGDAWMPSPVLPQHRFFATRLHRFSSCSAPRQGQCPAAAAYVDSYITAVPLLPVSVPRARKLLAPKNQRPLR